MPTKRSSSAPVASDVYFAKELAGEIAPSFAAMKSLYELASDLYDLRPWQVLDETQLILIRDSVNGEVCYCSTMGALGEVYSMHAYIGAEGLRIFRKIEADELDDPGEFFASVHSVYVEFVPKAQLQRPDRELLATLGHPQQRGLASPIFRAIRPGFHPWFVTAEEARTLAECIRAVILICTAVSSGKNTKFWDLADTYPMVTRVDEAEPRYQIDLVKPTLSPKPPIAPARLSEEALRRLHRQDYVLRGKIDLDYIFSAAPVGGKNERKACLCLALAVDAETGMVYATETTDASVMPGDALVGVFLKAIQTSCAVPKEVRVRNQQFKDSIAPIIELLGVKLRVASRLPAADEARAHLLGFLRGEK